MTWFVDVERLVERARREKKWLRSYYQGLWFTPDELAEHHRNGRFRWGVDNWELCDPQERIKELEQNLERAETALKRAKESL